MGFSERDAMKREGQLLGDFVFDLVNTSSRRKVKYNITTGIALEVISNPYDYLNRSAFETGKETIRDVLSKRLNTKDYDIDGGIKSNELIDFIPMNTAFVNIIDNDHNGEPVICVPFFQSHFSLPLKPGEHVWVLEEIFQEDKILYYWIGRKPGFLQSEDLNFTNVEREKSITSIVNKFFFKQGTENPSEESLNNSLSFNIKSDYLTKPLEQLFLQSNAYREEFTGEPVPRKVKNCSDVLIQGSNNTGIHLTTEKFEAEFEPTQFTSSLLKRDTNARRKPDSGAIDIFVSRKRSDIEALKETKTALAAGSNINIAENTTDDKRFQFHEIDKMADVRNKDLTIHNTEIVDNTDDAVNVAGRLYITANSNFDDIFQSSLEGSDTISGPAAILFGKNSRVVGESNTKITSTLGQSFVELKETGEIKIQASNKINLAVRADGVEPGEPYILYSELREILEKIVKDISVSNALVKLLSDTSLSNPLMAAPPPINTIPPTIATALATAAGSAAPNVATGPNIDGLSSGYADVLLKIGSGNSEATRGSIASSKIFGE
jgi:hypothetical protein